MAVKTRNKKKWVEVYGELKKDIENGGYERGDTFLIDKRISNVV